MACYTHEITSVTAYLMGVRAENFKKKGEEKYFADIDVFNSLEKNKKAKIVRSLCMVRNGFMKNFKQISLAVNGKTDGIRAGIHGLYDYIPGGGEEAVTFLEKNGITFPYKHQAAEYIPLINTHIKDRINNVKELYPSYVEWEYIRNFFVMPDGANQEGCKAEAERFYSAMTSYPFYCYVNWKKPNESTGKALYSDKVFLELLYADNRDEFTRMDLVTEADARTYDILESFLEGGSVAMLVDCENASPFYLYSFLKGLDESDAIEKIILFNDRKASSAWCELPVHLEGFNFETVLCERALEHKSLVDIQLTARTMREYYGGKEKFIIISSDSDYYGLIRELPEAGFLMMPTRENSSSTLIGRLVEHGTKYIFIEDYSHADAFEFARVITRRRWKSFVDESFPSFNVKDKMNELISDAFPNLTEGEQDEILRAIRKNTVLKIDSEYNLKVEC